MKVERVLVIGGNGFIGHHATAALMNAGAEVTVFDRPGSAPCRTDGRPALLAEPRQLEGTVTDPTDVEEAVGTTKPDVVVSLAAFGRGQFGLLKAAEHDPRGALLVNVLGLLNVLETASRHAGTRVVWTSSTTVYGREDHYRTPVDEKSLVGPASLYAVTKLSGEQLIRSFRTRRDVDAVAMRPTLVWGPGIRYQGVQGELSEMVEATAHRTPVEVADSDEPWDLLYVRDAGGAIAWLAAAPTVPEIILVNGYRASVRDVRNTILEARPDAEIHLAGRAPRLGFPHVDDRLARHAGFHPAYDLRRSVTDYLATAESNTDRRRT